MKLSSLSTCLSICLSVCAVAHADNARLGSELGIFFRDSAARGECVLLGSYKIDGTKSVEKTAEKPWFERRGGSLVTAHIAANATWRTIQAGRTADVFYVGIYEYAGKNETYQHYPNTIFVPCRRVHIRGRGHVPMIATEVPIIVSCALNMDDYPEATVPTQESMLTGAVTQHKAELAAHPEVTERLRTGDQSSCLFAWTLVRSATNEVFPCIVHEGAFARSTRRFYDRVLSGTFTPEALLASFRTGLKLFRTRCEHAEREETISLPPPERPKVAPSLDSRRRGSVDTNKVSRLVPAPPKRQPRKDHFVRSRHQR